MMWNYRIVRTQYGVDDSYDICEVYYEDGKPIAYALDKNVLSQDTLQDLKDCYERIAEAYKKPVLQDINGELVEIVE